MGQATGLVPRKTEGFTVAGQRRDNRTSLTITHFAIAKLDEGTRRAGRKREVDAYLRGVGGPNAASFQKLCSLLLRAVPAAEQVISDRISACELDGQTVAGVAAFKTHLSYLPFSGSVLGQLEDLSRYTMTKSSLHFTVAHPLSPAIVDRLLAVRLAEVAAARSADAVDLGGDAASKRCRT